MTLDNSRDRSGDTWGYGSVENDLAWANLGVQTDSPLVTMTKANLSKLIGLLTAEARAKQMGIALGLDMQDYGTDLNIETQNGEEE